MNQANREQLCAALTEALYRNSTAAVFFHTAIAEQVGLGATDEKTLFILRYNSPLSAGEIAQQTGLTTASVTNLIDRLERKGFVQRVRDTVDRRRVIVQLNEARLAELDQIFQGLQTSFETLFDDYSDAELVVITNFLTRATSYSHAAMEALKQAHHAEEKGEESGD